MKNDESTVNIPAADTIDGAALKDIYNVLWQKYPAGGQAGLPSGLTGETEKKLSPAAFGRETVAMLHAVKTAFLPLVQRYPFRYDLLSRISRRGLTTRQAYNIGDLMGQDYFKGYAGMKSIKALKFPRDHSSHNNFPAGWYFFAGGFKDQYGNYVDLLVNFFRRAIYPPHIARKMGLSEMDNQVVELQIGLSLSDKNVYIQGSNPVISGKTGLIDFNHQPFSIKMGKNEVKSVKPDSMFPLTVKIYDPEKDLDIDLVLEQTKPLFLQGDNGKVPSMYNLGTWYYSIPNIKTRGTITCSGDKREVSGKTWFDNQWTAGIMPAGYPDNYFIRALSNILNRAKKKTIEPWGWDWTQVQLDNNIEITVAAMHSTHTKDLNNKGENPPAAVKREATGKLINSDGKAEDISGSILIDGWVRSGVSKAWYPNSWKLEIPSRNIALRLSPTVSSQLFQGAAASEFREGGVKVTGKFGNDDITGIGFGEGTGYAGDDYYYGTKFDMLGIENNELNMKIFLQPVPGLWLAVQSLLLFIIPACMVIAAIVFIFFLLF